MSLVRSFGAALSELATGVSEHVSALVRQDGWSNLVTGLGTNRDKTQATCFRPRYAALDDVTLAALHSYNGIASRVCEAYPRQEMRLGFGLSGFDPTEISLAQKYLRQFALPQTITDARIWGNVFGGSIIWPLLDDGLDPDEPLDLTKIRSVLGLRVIDRRWVLPETYYYTGAKAGWPELYRIVQPTQGGSLITIGLIHESRVITFPGARTEWLKKVSLRMWDLSQLERVYEALRSEGNVWGGIETLVSDANQGVFKIKDLWNLVTSDPNQQDDAANGTGVTRGPSGKLLKRISFMDQTRSAGRAIVLDQENEEFERVKTEFSGLADLSDRGYQRIAADAEIPVTILKGESPAGLNATGDSDLRWWFAACDANRTQLVEPRLRQLLRILFAAQDAPKLATPAEDPTQKAKLQAQTKAKQTNPGEQQGPYARPPQALPKSATASPRGDSESETVMIEAQGSPADDIAIIWPPLWAATAKELSEIRLARAQEAQIWITQQVLLPEEVALSLGDDSEWKFDREARKDILDDNAEELLNKRAENALNPPQPMGPDGKPLPPKDEETDPKGKDDK